MSNAKLEKIVLTLVEGDDVYIETPWAKIMKPNFQIVVSNKY